MLITVLLLIACALMAMAGVPLILKLVPPNEMFGFVTERATSKAERWYKVNVFAGKALVAAAAVSALLIMAYSNTLLRPAWLQILAVLLPVGIAVGVTFWYEKNKV